MGKNGQENNEKLTNRSKECRNLKEKNRPKATKIDKKC